MIKFIGEYTAKIDDKGRLVLPSVFKSALIAEGAEGQADMRLVVKKDIYEPCLEMYSFAEWTRQSEELKNRLNFLNRDHSKFWRTYMSGRVCVVPDEKVGRMMIPKALLEAIGAKREVVFCGVDHKIEIWAKEYFEQSVASNEEFISIAEKL